MSKAHMIYPHLDPCDHPPLLALAASGKVPTVWDPRYVSHAAPLTSTTKAGLIMAAHRDQLAIVTPPLDDLTPVWDHVRQWHAPGYVNAVIHGTPRRLAESMGFTWSAQFADSVARIWAGQHWAHQLAHGLGRPILHPVSGAHHAHPEHGGGFCTFNYVVAALAMVKTDRPQARIAVIDLDAHYGDGTMACARAHPGLDLHVFDIHGGRHTRRVEHRGRLEQYLARAVPDARAYSAVLRDLPDWLRQHAITDAVYLAGVDPYEHDHVGGIAGVTEDFLHRRDVDVINAVHLAGIATVVNFAGGYVKEKVVDLHGGTISAMRILASGPDPRSARPA